MKLNHYHFIDFHHEVLIVFSQWFVLGKPLHHHVDLFVACTPIVPLHHATKRELWTTYQPKVLGHLEPIFCTLELVSIPINHSTHNASNRKLTM
jgi:hypothetical protein